MAIRHVTWRLKLLRHVSSELEQCFIFRLLLASTLLFSEFMFHLSHVKQIYSQTMHLKHELIFCTQITRRTVYINRDSPVKSPCMHRVLNLPPSNPDLPWFVAVTWSVFAAQQYGTCLVVKRFWVQVPTVLGLLFLSILSAMRTWSDVSLRGNIKDLPKIVRLAEQLIGTEWMQHVLSG